VDDLVMPYTLHDSIVVCGNLSRPKIQALLRV